LRVLGAQYQSITKFDIDAMEGESFSPPSIEIVGAKVTDALFPEDDVVALEIDGCGDVANRFRVLAH
jgi:hypothetical protein